MFYKINILSLFFDLYIYNWYDTLVRLFFMFKILRYTYCLLIFCICSFGVCDSYVLWFKSFDNTLSQQLQIESQNDIFLPVVSIILSDKSNMDKFWSEYDDFSGVIKNKIIHITLSPSYLSAKEVAEGKFDSWYMYLFEKIKKNNLKVIFRTMHEMNGGWYPWSSNPHEFKKARVHVYELSRKANLDKTNILFDWSINHRDMVSTDIMPSQWSNIMRCEQKNPKKWYCPILEDYYPGNEYVDLVWFSYYNRGKASYDRKWLDTQDILSDDNFFDRISLLNKPIIIDEFATTSVYYKGQYNQQKSIKSYQNQYDFKNNWLKKSSIYIAKQKNIVAAIYFNIDYTIWLTNWIIGEADRAIINPTNNKIYTWRKDLYDNSQKSNNLTYMFVNQSSWAAMFMNSQST